MENKVDNLVPRPIDNSIKPNLTPLSYVSFYTKNGVTINVPVDDVAEVIVFIAALADTIGKTITGGWVGGAIGFVGLVPKAVNAIEGFNHIPGELKYMTANQKTDLVNLIKANTNFPGLTNTIISVAIDIAFGIKTLLVKKDN